ncbi:hypothetical protein V8G54_010296 [Vigna mungo]|uniref:Uncharacterized protein n=1 Tax=Vigna mungo TaxID=3915 RepID=A0AAQ3S6B9_VIGMU
MTIKDKWVEEFNKPWMPSHQLFVEDSTIFLIVQKTLTPAQRHLAVDIWTESEHLQETICILQKIFELVFLQWNLSIECPWLPARQHSIPDYLHILLPPQDLQ